MRRSGMRAPDDAQHALGLIASMRQKAQGFGKLEVHEQRRDQRYATAAEENRLPPEAGNQRHRNRSSHGHAQSVAEHDQRHHRGAIAHRHIFDAQRPDKRQRTPERNAADEAHDHQFPVAVGQRQQQREQAEQTHRGDDGAAPSDLVAEKAKQHPAQQRATAALASSAPRAGLSKWYALFRYGATKAIAFRSKPSRNVTSQEMTTRRTTKPFSRWVSMIAETSIGAVAGEGRS